MPRHGNAIDERSDPQWFSTTHWSVVLSAGQPESLQACEALEKLCRCYWPPLYSYIRRQGHGPEEAQDLTQAFFAKLLKKNFWARADRQKGRFRSFLLTALRHFLADERDRGETAKRGGGLSFISLDEHPSEERFLEGLGQNLSSEKQFDRQWAATVLEQARAKLHQECAASGKLGLYDRVSLVDGGNDAVPHRVIAEELGMSLSAVKSAVSRLRARYGELVRQEVAHTVSSSAEIEAEIRYLLSVIGALNATFASVCRIIGLGCQKAGCVKRSRAGHDQNTNVRRMRGVASERRGGCVLPRVRVSRRPRERTAKRSEGSSSTVVRAPAKPETGGEA